MTATKSTYARPSREVLNRMYTTLELGCPDIAWLYERDAKTVHYWLRKEGIPTRPRGVNPGPQFKPGQRNGFAGRKHSPESIAKVRASTLADGRVPYLRGGKHWLHTVPPDHNPNWKGGATPERQEFYRSDEWKQAVVEVWRRADACCERCSKDWREVRVTDPTFHVHHIVSFAFQPLRAAVTNLVLLCMPCHYFVQSSANVLRELLQDAPQLEVTA